MRPIPWPISPIPEGAGPGLYAAIRRLEGMAAFMAGQPITVCPYPPNDCRQFDVRCWIDGYNQARGPQTPT